METAAAVESTLDRLGSDGCTARSKTAKQTADKLSEFQPLFFFFTSLASASPSDTDWLTQFAETLHCTAQKRLNEKN